MAEQIKVLMFHPALAPYRIDFFNAMADRFDLTVVLQRRNVDGQHFDQERLCARARFKYRYMPGVELAHRNFSRGYARLIRELRPDVVIGSEYGQTVMVPWLLRLMRRRKYRLWTFCDDSVRGSEETSRIRRILRRFFVPRLDGIVLGSDAVQAWYRERMECRRTAVIPIISDEDVLRSALAAQLPVIPEESLAGRRIVLFVGRLAAVKNLPVLLRAMPMVREDAVCVLVGEGPERPALEALVRQLGLGERVRFAGRFEAPELYRWYQMADVKVLPSLFEPFGAVVGEALQAGCPVVCSDIAGAACLIRPGINGEIVDHTSPEAVAGAVNAVLSRTERPSPDRLRPSLMPCRLEDFIDNLAALLCE